MNKIVALLCAAIFAIVSLAFAETPSTSELRPLQKLMRERAAMMKAMNENLGAGKFEAIVKDANALAAQAKKVGEGAPNPLAKELHLAVANLAGELSAAATNGNAEAVKAKLGEVKAKCAECHAKIRDKDKK